MKNIGNSIKKSLQKRHEALTRFKDRKEAFLLSQQQIRKEIEDARDIWKRKVEQLPNRKFK